MPPETWPNEVSTFFTNNFDALAWVICNNGESGDIQSATCFYGNNDIGWRENINTKLEKGEPVEQTILQSVVVFVQQDYTRYRTLSQYMQDAIINKVPQDSTQGRDIKQIRWCYMKSMEDDPSNIPNRKFSPEIDIGYITERRKKNK